MMVKRKKLLAFLSFMLIIMGGSRIVTVHGFETERDAKKNNSFKEMIWVAHEDDDLLFMNPDLINHIEDGRTVETIYVTAGDKGKGPGYWLAREDGVRAAYAYMAHVSDSWQQSVVDIGNQKITKFTLRALPRITLVFLRLPDGIDDRTGEVTLKTMWNDQNAVAHSKDNLNFYTKAGLQALFQDLMAEFHPDRINYIYPGVHVDHRHVAKFVQLAQKRYRGGRCASVKYQDYAINNYPPNLMEDQTTKKWKIARIYGRHDWYFPKFMLEKKYRTYYNWCKREYRE